MSDDAHLDTEPGGPIEFGPIARWQRWWQLAADRAADPYHADPVLALGARQGFVLSTAQVRELQVSRAQERTRLANGTWTTAGAGAIAPIDVRAPDAGIDPDGWLIARRKHALVAATAAMRRPRQVVSGRSAAVLHGLPTFGAAERPVLTVGRPRWSGRQGAAHARKAGLLRAEVCCWHGVPVTTIGRTLVDLARHNRRDGIVAADAALREGFVTLAEMNAALARAAGWPGVRSAREVLRLASAHGESALESIVRLALHDDGFPPPQLQAVIVVPGRHHSYRVDFLWPERRLVLEADGRTKYTADELWREKQREHVLRRLGYRVERVLWADIVQTWDVTRSLLWDAFAR